MWFKDQVLLNLSLSSRKGSGQTQVCSTYFPHPGADGTYVFLRFLINCSKHFQTEWNVNKLLWSSIVLSWHAWILKDNLWQWKDNAKRFQTGQLEWYFEIIMEFWALAFKFSSTVFKVKSILLVGLGTILPNEKGTILFLAFVSGLSLGQCCPVKLSQWWK